MDLVIGPVETRKEGVVSPSGRRYSGVWSIGALKARAPGCMAQSPDSVIKGGQS